MKDNDKIDNYTEFKITNRQISFFILIVVLILITFVVKMIDKPTENTTNLTPERPTKETNKEPESTNAYAQVESLKVMSPSDELSAIEADLKSTNLDSLTLELLIIESELNNN